MVHLNLYIPDTVQRCSQRYDPGDRCPRDDRHFLQSEIIGRLSLGLSSAGAPGKPPKQAIETSSGKTEPPPMLCRGMRS